MKGTRVEIDLDALRYNYKEIRHVIPKDVMIAGVVKANAYGHDLITIARELERLGVDYLGVANIGEAKAIRKNGVACPLLVMGKTFEEDYDFAVKHEITLTIFNLEDARKLNLNASYDNIKAKVHIKFDSGFNRLGYNDIDKLVEDLEEIKSYEFLEVEGLFTHLALKDVEADDAQFDRFDALLKRLRELSYSIPIKHVCDSIGAIAYPNKLYDMVRLGAILYGYCSRKTPFDLKPVMSMKTNLSHIKEIEIGDGISYDYTFVATQKMKVGTLPIGYADGYPRNLSNIGYVSIRGKHAPILGLLCMDQCMVDITDIEDVKVGDEVIIFDDGNLTLTELAKLSKTNRNELLSRVAIRVPRVILADDEDPVIIQYMDKI